MARKCHWPTTQFLGEKCWWYGSPGTQTCHSVGHDELDSNDKATEYFKLKHMIVPVAVDGNSYSPFYEHQSIGGKRSNALCGEARGVTK